MANEKTPATPAQKKKTQKVWMWVGGIVLLLVIAAILIMVFRPFTAQKKAWLKSQAGNDQKAKDIFDKMSSAEIKAVYCAIHDYKDKGKTDVPPDTRKALDAINVKYGTDF